MVMFGARDTSTRKACKSFPVREPSMLDRIASFFSNDDPDPSLRFEKGIRSVLLAHRRVRRVGRRRRRHRRTPGREEGRGNGRSLGKCPGRFVEPLALEGHRHETVLAFPVSDAGVLVGHALHLEGMVELPVLVPVESLAGGALEKTDGGREEEAEDDDRAADEQRDGEAEDAEGVKV